MEINEYKVKLGGKANISRPLTLGKLYSLTITEAECREVKEIPCDNGEKDTIYSIVISELSDMKIISENGILPAKKKGSMSKLLRYKIFQLAEASGIDEELLKENYYGEKMKEIIERIDSELSLTK